VSIKHNIVLFVFGPIQLLSKKLLLFGKLGNRFSGALLVFFVQLLDFLTKHQRVSADDWKDVDETKTSILASNSLLNFSVSLF